MSAFTAINLEKFDPPTIIARKGFGTVLSEITEWLIERDPSLEAALALESEPIAKVIQAWAYREMLLRAEVDDAGKGNMLAFAAGAQLDHLGAFFGVQRAVVQAADPDARPPVPEVLEDDARLRQRVQLSLEGFTTAGSRGAYVFWGLSASPNVKDISIESTVPGEIIATVLSTEGDGTASVEILGQVSDTLSAEEVRPLCDYVIVNSAEILTYEIDADLTFDEGPDSAVVANASKKALDAYVETRHRLGHDVTLSGIYAALHQEGVQKVNLKSPFSDIAVSSSQAAFCTKITVTDGAVNV